MTVFPTSGILDQTGILNVAFEVAAYLVNPVSSYSWDFNGDGTPEITGTEATVMAQYQYPGLYFPRVTVSDTQGNIYVETAVVHVLSREEMDALLKSKWGEMRTRLASGDIEGALFFFDESTKEDFRRLFNILSPVLQTIAQDISDIQFIEYIENAAIYDIYRIRNGIDYSFQLLFIKGSDGIWRIDSF